MGRLLRGATHFMPKPRHLDEAAMLKSNAKDLVPHEAIGTASAKSTVVHVDFGSPTSAAQKNKIRNAKPALHVQDIHDIDQILTKLREEMSKFS
jgi:hypothetical protein